MGWSIDRNFTMNKNNIRKSYISVWDLNEFFKKLRKEDLINKYRLCNISNHLDRVEFENMENPNEFISLVKFSQGWETCMQIDHYELTSIGSRLSLSPSRFYVLETEEEEEKRKSYHKSSSVSRDRD